MSSTYPESQQRAPSTDGEAGPNYRAFFEAAPDPYLVLDAGQRIAAATDAFLRAAGLPRERVLGRPLSEVFPDANGHRAAGPGERLLAFPDGRLRRATVAALGDGSRLLRLGEPIREEPGGLDPHRLEELVRSKLLFQRIADLTPDIVYVYDFARNRNVYANGGVARILGYPNEFGAALDADTFRTLVHPDDLPALYADPGQTLRLADGEVIEREYRLRHADGSWRWLRTRELVFERNPDGSPRQLLGLAQDVTERKRSVLALRASEERYERAAEAGRVGVWEWEVGGEGLYLAPNLKRMLGYADHELPDRMDAWCALVHPDDQERVKAATEAHLAGRTAEYEVEARRRHVNGEYLWFLARGVASRDPAGRPLRLTGSDTDITERKRGESELRRSRRLLERIAETTPALLFVQDLAENQNAYENRDLARVLGYPPGAGSGPEFLAAVMHPDDRPRHDEALRVLRDAPEGAVAGIEYRLRDAAGRWRWFAGRATVFRRDADGRPRQILRTALDVTDRKNSEERVRFQARLLEAVGQAVVATDLDGRVLYWNRAAESIYGWTRGEALGRNVVDLLPAEDSRGLAAEIMAKLRAGEGWSGEFRVRSKGGEAFPALVADTPFRNERGEVVGIIGVSADLSAQKRAEEAVRRSETRYRRLIEESPLSIQILAPDGGTRQVNRAWEELFGATLDQIADYNMLRDEQLVKLGIMPYVRRAFAGEAVVIPPVAYVPDRGKYQGRPRWSRAVMYPLKEDGRVEEVVLIHEDITDRKLLEEELRQRVEELAEADRRKDEFLAMLGHELRNPLAPIRNALKIMKTTPAGPTLEGLRGAMDRQVEHLVRMVDDLLDVSRILQGKIELRPEPAELSAVVARAVETAQPAIDARGHELVVSLPDGPVLLKGDHVRLAQVFANLLNNAAKYTPEAGRVWLSAAAEGDAVSVSVRDTGSGIAPELLPKVFDLFVQGDHSPARTQGGLGIGLTLVKKLVEMHGGTVEARSEGAGRGSEFVVRLPRYAGPVVGPTGEEPVGPAGRSERRRVLVVDDNVDAAESLAFVLRAAGHSVQTAHSGPEALEAAAEFRPEAVILDIGLPGMDGFAVARRLRQMPGVRGAFVLALTGYGQEEDRRRSAASGFDRHLVKPADPDLILELLGAGR